MSRFFAYAHRVHARHNRAGLFLSLVVTAFILALAAGAHAQFGAPPAGTRVLDPSVLRPPAGARVALVEFADMECPDCARANPLLKEAVAKYKIPWVRRDFPLAMHNWSFQAAVNARWFDTRSKSLGDEYRDQVFAAQASIVSPNLLRQFTEKFAATRKASWPPTSRQTMPSASASASSTRPPSGWSQPTAKAHPSSRFSTAPSSFR